MGSISLPYPWDASKGAQLANKNKGPKLSKKIKGRLDSITQLFITLLWNKTKTTNLVFRQMKDIGWSENREEENGMSGALQSD